ncbi:glycoside hydrolase family 97 N-terminal domain-containing protein [Zobellia amurskyensis]|nr:glycoside hydrolase family 97 N-terminal domain-containing protein [Zobellia amurskyensis]
MNSKRWLVIGVILLLAIITEACSKENTYALQSPDQSIELTFETTNGSLNYQISWNGHQAVKNSELSIFPNTKVKITDTKVSSADTTWNPVWGQFSEIQDAYNELEISLDYEGIPATLYVRAYDGGSAFRFVINSLPEAAEPSFYIEYGLSATDEIYMPAGEGMPKGPIVLSDLAQMDSIPYRWHVPLVIETGQNDYISLLESDLVSAPGFSIIDFEYDKKRKNSFRKINLLPKKKTDYTLALIAFGRKYR